MLVDHDDVNNQLTVVSNTIPDLDLSFCPSSDELRKTLAGYVDRALEYHNISPIIFIDQSGSAKEVRFSAMHGVQINDADFCALTKLTVDGAKALDNYKTELLELDGLIELSPKVAQCLAAREGGLSLQGLEEIDVGTAKALATHKDYDADACLYGLYLELQRATPEVVDALSKKVGTINDMPSQHYCDQLRDSNNS